MVLTLQENGEGGVFYVRIWDHNLLFWVLGEFFAHSAIPNKEHPTVRGNLKSATYIPYVAQSILIHLIDKTMSIQLTLE